MSGQRKTNETVSPQEATAQLELCRAEARKRALEKDLKKDPLLELLFENWQASYRNNPRMLAEMAEILDEGQSAQYEAYNYLMRLAIVTTPAIAVATYFDALILSNSSEISAFSALIAGIIATALSDYIATTEGKKQRAKYIVKRIKARLTGTVDNSSRAPKAE